MCKYKVYGMMILYMSMLWNTLLATFKYSVQYFSYSHHIVHYIPTTYLI